MLLRVTAAGEVLVDRVCEGSSAAGLLLPGDVFTRVGAEAVVAASAPFLATKLLGPEHSKIGSAAPPPPPRREAAVTPTGGAATARVRGEGGVSRAA